MENAEFLFKFLLDAVWFKLNQDLTKMEEVMAPGPVNREFKSISVDLGRRAGHTTAACYLANTLANHIHRKHVVFCVMNYNQKKWLRRTNALFKSTEIFSVAAQGDLEGLRTECTQQTIVIVDTAGYIRFTDKEWLLANLSPRLFVFVG